MDENLKNSLKKNLRRLVAIIMVIVIVLFMILPGAVYVTLLDDGTFEEDDWGNTPYAASQYTADTSIEGDGNIATNMTAQELWDKMMDEGGRVNNYLDGPEELLKLMNAQMVTQYLDTRPNPDDPINWEEILDINSNKVQGIIKLKEHNLMEQRLQ